MSTNERAKVAPTKYTKARIEAAADRELVDRLIAKINTITWGNPSVAHLVETPEPHRHVERDQVDVKLGGFVGDHARKSFFRGKYVSGREVSAMAIEVLHVIKADPLIVGDNLITEGIDLSALKTGDHLQVGEVLLERSWREHRPCVPFRNRTSPEAFSAVSRTGARGALFVVKRAGRIRRGDSLYVL